MGLTIINSILEDYLYEEDETDIVIPDGVTEIGKNAFTEFESIESIFIPASVTRIGEYAFYRCDGLQNITVAPDNPCFSSVDGVLFDKSRKTLILYPLARQDTDYRIPDSVEIIADNAFAFSEGGCLELQKVIIPDSVKSIGDLR